MGELTENFKGQAVLEQAESLIEQNADVDKEPILLSKEGVEYSVHRFDWHDILPNSGDIDNLNQLDFIKQHFDETPRTLEDCQKAQHEIADVRHALLTEALETYNEAAEAGHGPGILEFDPESPDYIDDVQQALRVLLLEGYLGGEAYYDYQERADKSDFPADTQAKISDNVSAATELGVQAEQLDVRMRDITADMAEMDMDVTKNQM